EEARTPPLELSDFSLTPLEQQYPGYTAQVETQGKDRAVLVLQHPTAPALQTRIVVDTARHVVLSVEDRQGDKVTTATRCDDFVGAAAGWWARKVETRDARGRRTSLTTQTVKDVTADELRQHLRKELAAREQVQFLREPLPKVVDAKRALQAGKAGFEDHVALLRHFAAAQQWTRAQEHLEKAEALAPGKSGMRWLRDALPNGSRRHEDLRKRLLAEAEELARSPRDADDYALAGHVVGQASGVLSAPEMLLLLDRVRPVYEARPPQVLALKGWGE